MEKDYLQQELFELIQNDSSIFDFIQENLFDGLWYWDLEEPENEWMNERFWTTLGYNPLDMPQKASAWKAIIFPEDLDLINHNLQKHLDDPTHSYDQIVRFKHKDGSTVWIRCFGKAICDKDNKPIRLMGAHQDITSLKNSDIIINASRQALESEKKFRRMFAKSPLAIYMSKGPDIKAEYINHTFIQLFGYTMREVPTAAHWWPKAFPDEVYRVQIMKEWNQKMGKAIAEKSDIEPVDAWVQCKDGSKKYIRWYFNSNGNENWAFGLDLTSQKKSSETLKDAKQKLEKSQFNLIKAQKIAHLGSWYLDVKTNEVEWTEELYKMYGFDPSLPPPPYPEHQKLFIPESWNLLNTSLEKTRTEGIPYELELKTIKKDGSNGWMWVRGEAVYNNKNEITGLWGAAQDITRQKHIEEELIKTKTEVEESEQQFRLLFENMEQGFALHKMIYDKANRPIDYQFVLLNKAFEKVTGLKVKDCLGKTVKQVLPNIEDVWIENYSEVASSGIPLRFENYAKELESYYEVTAYSPKKGYFATVITDVTKIKTYEKNIIKAKNEAEESNQLKSAFLANMSHEIRTPMNAIIGFASFLKDPSNPKGEIEKYADIIMNEGNHLLNLINDIIDISKIDAGQITISKSKVDLNALLIDLYNTFHSGQLSKNNFNIHLKVHMPVKKMFLLTDETRLRQILMNLIGNALKFTHEGEIEFGYDIENDKIRFFVSDTGIGIAKEKQTKIFDRFQQAAHETEKIYGGTGLGLSIAKACTELLGGDIWLESEVDKGTTFYFTILHVPIHINKKNWAHPKLSDYEFNNELILIAEDEDYNYKYLETALAKYKLQLIRSKTGRETIEKALSDDHIQLILMDIQMPDLTGIEATVEIRKLKPELPIIAQTAYAMNNDKQKFMAIGCTDYLAKPIKKEQLIRTIYEHLHKDVVSG